MMDLLDLPAELIASIISYLEPEDVFSVRQGTKYLENASRSHFGRRFFRKKGFLVTTLSIRVLQSIASHDYLRKYVQHVWFNPDCYTFVKFEDTLENYRYSDRSHRTLDHGSLSTTDRQRLDALTDCVQDHKSLMNTPGMLARQLSSAFQLLPNLSVIGMRRSEDFDPCGWRRLHHITGIDPRIIGTFGATPMYDALDIPGPTTLFAAINHALAATPISLTRLYTDSINVEYLPPNFISQERHTASYRELLYLEINLYSDDRSNRTTENENCNDCLLQLVKACPNLAELGLQIFYNGRRSYLGAPHNGDLFSWLRAYPHLALKRVAEGVRMVNLTRLKLEKMTTTPEVLRSLMSPSQHGLASVKLRDMRLMPSGHERPWKPVFEFFRDGCPHLTYILLHHLMDERGAITFVETRDPPHDPDRDYLGPTHHDEFFAKYDHVALQAVGQEEVRSKMARIVEEHWHQSADSLYGNIDELYYTDTSDEES